MPNFGLFFILRPSFPWVLLLLLVWILFHVIICVGCASLIVNRLEGLTVRNILRMRPSKIDLNLRF